MQIYPSFYGLYLSLYSNQVVILKIKSGQIGSLVFHLSFELLWPCGRKRPLNLFVPFRLFFTNLHLILFQFVNMSLLSLCARRMQEWDQSRFCPASHFPKVKLYPDFASNVFCLNHLNHLMEKITIDSKRVLHTYSHFINHCRFSVLFFNFWK